MDPAGLVKKRRKCLLKVSEPTGGWLCLGAHVITARYISSWPLELKIYPGATITEYTCRRSPQHNACHLLSVLLAIHRFPGHVLITRSTCIGRSTHAVCHCTEYTGIHHVQHHSRRGPAEVARMLRPLCCVWPQCKGMQTRGTAHASTNRHLLCKSSSLDWHSIPKFWACPIRHDA